MDNFLDTIPFLQVIIIFVVGALMHFTLRIIDVYIIPLEKGERALLNKLWQRVQIILWFIYGLFFYATLFWKNRNLTILFTVIILGLGWQYWTHVFAGIMIKYNNQLKVGDIIKTDFVSGKLKKIKLASSELINNKGELVIIPNQKLKNAVLKHQQVKTVIKTHRFIVNPQLANSYDAVTKLAINCPYLASNQKIKIKKEASNKFSIEAVLIDYSFVAEAEKWLSLE